MDPPAMINDGAFQRASAPPYNLSEIWPFSANGGECGGGLDLSRVQSGQGLGQFTEISGVSREVSGNDPMVLDRSGSEKGGYRKRRGAAPEEESAKDDSDCKWIKIGGSRDESPESGAEADANPKPPEPQKQDYIHVRARRGQATDSHSLAERARREKIGERMKILQDLVPGCTKVIGKALVLDEIINYIQSLQHQVEFLSMKLEAVNSKTNTAIEGFQSKDFGSQATRDYERGSSPEWLHMQLGSGFERKT